MYNPLKDKILTKVTSENDAVDIHKKIYHDFPFPGQSRANDTYSYFKASDGFKFLARYDEPTYLTFRINFIMDNSDLFSTNGMMKYDYIPHPLFVLPKDVKDYTINGNKYHDYSTVDYLRNNLGEEYRADLLEEFIKGLRDISYMYPYYFTSIEGISDLMKVDTTWNRRLKPGTTITINCMEALDMRITQLLNLYRKVAWDDVYQRWILPDMMRFFKMEIYISEMRVFHTTKAPQSFTNWWGGEKVGSNSTTLTSITDFNNFIKMAGDAMNEVLPTIKLELSQCEFDMTDAMSHIGTLKSSKHNDQLQPKLKIKVGNVKEYQLYGLNRDIEDIIIKANNSGTISADNNYDLHRYYLSDDMLTDLYNSDNEDAYLDVEFGSDIKSMRGVKYNTAISSSLTRTGTKLFGNDSDMEYKKNWESDTASGVLGNLAKEIINTEVTGANPQTVLNDISSKVTQNDNKVGKTLNAATRMMGYTNLSSMIASTRFVSSALESVRSKIYESSVVKEILKIQNYPKEGINKLLQMELNAIYQLALQNNKVENPIVKEIKFMIDNNMDGNQMSDYIDALVEKDKLNNQAKPELKDVGEITGDLTKKDSIDSLGDRDSLEGDKKDTLTGIPYPNDNYIPSHYIPDVTDKDKLFDTTKPSLQPVADMSDNSNKATSIDDVLDDSVRDAKRDVNLSQILYPDDNYTKGTDIDGIIDSNVRNAKRDTKISKVPEPENNYKKGNSIDSVIDEKVINADYNVELSKIPTPNDNYERSTSIDGVIDREILNADYTAKMSDITEPNDNYEKAEDINNLINKNTINSARDVKLTPIGKPRTNYKSRGLINPKYLK